MSLEADTQAGFDAAPHLAAPQFGPARSALLALARKIDHHDDAYAAAAEYARESGTRPTMPQHDNVSMSAYFKALDTLGLTPLAWAKITGATSTTTPTTTEGTPDADSSTDEPADGKAARVTALRAGVRSA